MDLSEIKVFNVLKSKIGYHTQVQNTISDNIANVDTPNYQEKEVKKPNFAQFLPHNQQIDLAKTNPNHISTSSTAPFDVISTGRKVELNDQAIKIAKNTADFNAASASYKKLLSIVKETVGGQ